MDLKTYLWQVLGTELKQLLESFTERVEKEKQFKATYPLDWTDVEEEELNLLIECRDLTGITYNCYLGLQKPEDFDNYGT